MTNVDLQRACDELRREAAQRETQLVAERDRLAERLDAVSSITSTAIGTLDLQQMLDAVLARIVETLRATAASVLLLEESDVLVATASVGLEEEVSERFHLRVGDGFGGMIAKERRPLYSPEVTEDIRIRSPFVARHGIRSLLGVPLLAKDELVGVLRVGWAETHPFEQDEVELLQLAADRFAMAISNAKLYQAQQRIADTLQTAMLTMPDEVEGIEFAHLYRSATLGARVGGDFYDVFGLPSGRVGIVIGDVSGHGLEAAALTAIAKTTLKAYSLEYESPARIMKRANQVLVRESETNVFVTAFIGLLDLSDNVLSCCNAGHPPPILCTLDGCAQQIGAGQPLLGAFEESTYHDEEQLLLPGELLFLYTDGVLEARRSGGPFYGSDRLVETVVRVGDERTSDIPTLVFQDVVGFAAGRLTDDLALLAVRSGEPWVASTRP
jgi:serine phosphatase RsbU (regulator of sigma subunit)